MARVQRGKLPITFIILWKGLNYFWNFIVKWIDRILLKFSFYAKWHIRRLHKKFPHYYLESHCYITWKTGSWKSSLLEQLIYGRWLNSFKSKDTSVILLDPHWDTAEKIKKFDLVEKDLDRFVYIDPFLKDEHTPCINPFELKDRNKETIELHTQQLTRVFWEMIPDTKLSNYMKAILKPCLATLLWIPWTWMEDLKDFLSKSKCDKWVKIGKESLVQSHRTFFRDEFMSKIYDGTKWSIYTKIQSLLNSETFYNLTSGTSTIDLEKSVNQGKIMVFNLSKWKLGEEVSETFWRFIIAMVQSIAIKRSKIPPFMRKKIYLVIDEADTFLSWNSLNVILKETRKYWLHLILCTQNLVTWRDQEQLKRNLLNNTNVKVIWSNWVSTLLPLAKETGIPSEKLLRNPKHHFWIKRWSSRPIQIKTKDLLGKNSKLLSKKSRRINYRIFKESSYYKPKLEIKKDLDRIEDMPLDRQDDLRNEASPKPKFKLDLIHAQG